MAVDPEDPVDVLGDFPADLGQGGGELGDLRFALGVELGGPGCEQHLGLEHEPVADDADARVIAEDLAQPAEELRTILRQLLDPRRQGQVQPPAEIGDLDPLFGGLGFRRLEQGADALELFLQ